MRIIVKNWQYFSNFLDILPKQWYDIYNLVEFCLTVSSIVELAHGKHKVKKKDEEKRIQCRNRKTFFLVFGVS